MAKKDDKLKKSPINLIELERLKSRRLANDDDVFNSIVSSEHEGPDIILGIVHEFGARHVVQKCNPSSPTSLKTSALILGERQKFFSKPLVAIFRPDEINTLDEKELIEFEFVFTHGAQKSEVLSLVEYYLRTFTQRTTIIRDVLLVADELFTNAVYNAPFVTSAANQKSGASRNGDDVLMSGGKSGRLFAGRQDGFLVLGCEDFYGTLHVNSLINRIVSCYEKGADQVMNQDSVGGAGIGSYLVYQATNNFYALVESMKHTLVCCGFAYNRSNRDRTEMPKNVHIHGSEHVKKKKSA